MVVFMLIAGIIIVSVIGGILQAFHAILVALGLAQKKPQRGFWYWVDRMPSGGSPTTNNPGRPATDPSRASRVTMRHCT